MTTCLSLAVALSILGPDGTPRCDRTPAHAIPAASYVALEFAGLDACREAAGSLGIASLIETVAAPARRELMRELRGEWRHVEDVLERLELDRSTLRELIRSPMAVGVSRLTFFADIAMPSIAIAIDTSDREQRLVSAIKSALGNLQRARSLELEDRRRGESTTWILSHPRKNGRIAAAWTDDLLLLSNSPRYVRECLEAWEGDRKNLAGLDAREHGRETLGGNVLLSAVLNLDAVSGLLPYEVDDVADALGVRPDDRVFVGLGVDGKVSRELVHVHTRRAPKGLAEAMLPGRVRGKAAAYCAPETLVYGAGRIDVEAVGKAAHRLMQALPTEARHEVQRELGREITRELRRELGVDLGELPPEFEHLFAELSESEGEWTFAVPTPSLRSPIPHGLLVFEFEDANDLADAVHGALAKSTRLKKIEFRGAELHYLKISNGVRLSPSFCVHDGVLLAASDLRVLKSALVRKIEDKPSLADEGFETRIGSVKPSMFLSVRLREAIETYWPLVYSLASSAPEEELEGLDLDAVPEADEMLDRMADMKLGIARHKRGLDFVCESPVGLGAVLAVLGQTVDEFLSPKLN